MQPDEITYRCRHGLRCLIAKGCYVPKAQIEKYDLKPMSVGMLWSNIAPPLHFDEVKKKDKATGNKFSVFELHYDFVKVEAI